MMDFAVTVDGVTEEGQATWVLAVDPAGEQVLIVHAEDKSLHWHPLAECKLAKLASPDTPRPVVVLEPKRRGLVAPGNGLRDLQKMKGRS